MSKTLEQIHKIAFDYAIKNKQRFSSEGSFLISLHSNLEGYSLCQKEYEEKLRWIPVEEKLPEKQGHYLVKAPKSFPKNCIVVVAEFYEDNNTFYSESSDCPIEDATHWRFL